MTVIIGQHTFSSIVIRRLRYGPIRPHLSLRVEPALKAALEKAAEADRRTLAAYIEIVLSEHVEQLKKAKK